MKSDRIREFRTKPSRCPYCDYLLDAAASASSPLEHPPQIGDYTICLSCAQPLIFGQRMRLRKPRVGELEAKKAFYPDLQRELDFYTEVVRDMDRRPPEERDRPLPNRQQRRMQERQRRQEQHRRQVILIRLP
jgi:hypothetical protein